MPFSPSGLPEKGFFLVFEGPEGGGKSTHIQRLSECLKKMGHVVTLTREPGGTPFGDKIRDLMLSHTSGNIEPQTELSLMLAQRSEHLSKLIIPALKRGEVVISDRYLDSSLAYQGYGRSLTAELVKDIHLLLFGKCLPKLTILFDLDPAIGFSRLGIEGRNPDRLESEKIQFHEKVRNGYLSLAKMEANRFLIIDASKSPDSVYSDLENGLKFRIPELWK
ncbi:MAG: dTMP kinase [Candidatus Riflebacteria bacterium]|nr:dTMP kinase [Candidatus Riflebacteria bacterium]